MSKTDSMNRTAIHNSSEELNFTLAFPIPKSTPQNVEDVDSKSLDKTYLETEIDSYSGVEFTSKRFSLPARCRTPPKPYMRAFTFDSKNPFVLGPEQSASALYTTVNKPKTRPKIPPKPSLNKDVGNKDNPARLSTLSLANTPNSVGEGPTEFGDGSNAMKRVYSLPNIEPVHAGMLQPSNNMQHNNTIGYGMISKLRENGYRGPLSLLNGNKEVDYCDMIPESPPYMIPINSENIYEDVKIPSTTHPVGTSREERSCTKHTIDGEYTEMSSPLSDINFKFEKVSIYENLPLHISSSMDNLKNDVDSSVLEPPVEFKSDVTNREEPNRLSGRYEYQKSRQNYANIEDTSSLSPTSSFTGRSSSAASTAASSFQGIQVCYFPPSPPKDFYGDPNTIGLPFQEKDNESISDLSHSSYSSSLSRRSSSRPSRSRIPVPVKSPTIPDKFSNMPVPEEMAPQLPPTPSPSPVTISKNKKKTTKQDIKLTPPSPPSGKGARWYEKLGCIQSDTLHKTEPYGLPGERKRSKSAGNDNRRSKFFVPVEPESDTSQQQTQTTNTE